jgi:hypothetical protein
LNRFRSRLRRCASITATHRSPGGIGPHQQNRRGPEPQQQNFSNVATLEPRENVGWIESRRNRNAPFARGFRSEGRTRQPSGNQRLQFRN